MCNEGRTLSSGLYPIFAQCSRFQLELNDDLLQRISVESTSHNISILYRHSASRMKLGGEVYITASQGQFTRMIFKHSITGLFKTCRAFLFRFGFNFLSQLAHIELRDYGFPEAILWPTFFDVSNTLKAYISDSLMCSRLEKRFFSEASFLNIVKYDGIYVVKRVLGKNEAMASSLVHRQVSCFPVNRQKEIICDFDDYDFDRCVLFVTYTSINLPNFDYYDTVFYAASFDHYKDEFVINLKLISTFSFEHSECSVCGVHENLAPLYVDWFNTTNLVDICDSCQRDMDDCTLQSKVDKYWL